MVLTPIDRKPGTNDDTPSVNGVAEGTPNETNLEEEKPAPKLVDILYRVRASDKHDTQTFYSDAPFKGLNTGLEAKDPSHDDGSGNVIRYHVEVYGLNKTGKQGTNIETFEEGGPILEFGKDFFVTAISTQEIEICSPLLQAVLRSIMIYHPQQASQGDFAMFPHHQHGAFRNLLLYYRDLKAFHEKHASGGNVVDGSELVPSSRDIGESDDGQVQNKQYDFGSLEEQAWDDQTFRHIAILLRFLAPLYRKIVVPELLRYELLEPVVSYDQLWLLFKPGEDVYFKKGQTWSGGVVEKIKYKDCTETKSGRLIVTVWNLVYQAGRLSTRRVASRGCLKS